MGEINFKDQIRRDRDRYAEMIKRYESGFASIGEVSSRGELVDMTPEMIVHLKTIVAELTALLGK